MVLMEKCLRGGGHMFVPGGMKIIPCSLDKKEYTPCCHAWFAIPHDTGEDDWNDFALLVEKHFRSTNEKDQNRLSPQNLKQKGHPIKVFLLKFKNYTLLADYNDTWQIELLEQNMDKDIVLHSILEKGCYAFL